MSRRIEICLAAFCLAIFSAISLATIGHFSPWHDESYSATLIQGSYSDVIHRTALDVHPPLFYLLLKTWSLVAGNSVTSLRLFSFVCMLGALILAWRLLRRMFGANPALAGLAAMSIGAFVIRYSQEMRMYGVGALLAMSLTYLFWRLISESLSQKKARLFSFTYIVLATISIYTHYFLAFIIIAHFAFLVLHKLEPAKWWRLPFSLGKRWYWIFGVPILGFLPWLPTMIDQFKQTHRYFWIPPFDFSSVPSTLSNYLFFRQGYELSGWSVAFGLTAIVAAGWVFVSWFSSPQERVRRDARRLVGCTLLIPVLLLILISLPPFKPYYYDRYFSFCAPLFYGSLGVAAFSVFRSHPQRLVRIILPAFLFITLLVGTVYTSKLGNNAGWSPSPQFTINQLDDFMNQKSPNTQVISTTLWTFFDAHITIGRYDKVMLYAPNGIGKYGNGSAVYNRYELQIKDLSQVKAKQVWILEESGLPPPQLPHNWTELARYQAGYARVVLYHINK